MLYPLKFDPIYKDKIWGGQKIKTVLGKDFDDLPNCGESWEISGVAGDISKVSNGALTGLPLDELIDKYKGALVGEAVYKRFGNEFPLLIKFIDANQDLSVQVHPDDELARKRHNGFGKTEMWYILQADKGATLISGFNQPMSRESYVRSFESGKLMEILNKEQVSADDVFFLPAGRVHTIGKGILLAEIQQTSDTTYRIYDFDRIDASGNKRQLHVEEAIEAIDYNFYDSYKTSYQNQHGRVNEIVKCDYFTTNKLVFEHGLERDYKSLDSFKILIGLEGRAEIITDGENVGIAMGESVLIPAELETVRLKTSSSFKMLETYVPV